MDSLAIVGVGLIGGSIGLAAKARSAAIHVVGIGRRAEVLAHAKSLGAVDEWTTDLPTGVRTANVVVICSPVDMIAVHAIEAAKHIQPGCLMTDAGSTKANIVRDVERQIPGHVHFVGAHPLAGSEKQGVAHARADLFESRTCVLTPTLKNLGEPLEQIRSFWKSLGCVLHEMSPEEHDLALATTSHLPHLVASLLAAELPARWQPLAATGFRDTTRIAAGDPGLWGAIADENALALSAALDRFAGSIVDLRDAVASRDNAAVVRVLTEGKKVRDALGS